MSRTVNVNVVAADHHRVIQFDSAVDTPESDASAAVVALLHLAVVSLNSDCDEPGSVIVVHINGHKLRTIQGPSLVDLGRRVRENSIKTVTAWWNETPDGLHPAPRG